MPTSEKIGAARKTNTARYAQNNPVTVKQKYLMRLKTVMATVYEVTACVSRY